MAEARRAATARRNIDNIERSRRMYVEGSAARRLQEMPVRRDYPGTAYPETKRRISQTPTTQPVQHRQLSKAAQKNREKANAMNLGFVIFLAIVSVAILFMSVHYLQLKSEITSSKKHIASLEAQLTELKEDNDAYYSQVSSNIDLNRIKKIAIGRLGMKYPTESQKRTYTTAGNSYVRQYLDIPTS